MSDEILEQEKWSGNTDKEVVIVASSFNKRYTDSLVENCLAEWERLTGAADVEVIRVPGAFEIPMVVHRVLNRIENPDAVIALGVIIRGSTAHADLIGEAITRELLKASCQNLTPVIHEVLLLDNEQQAEERCCGDKLNRGREAARTAVAMLSLPEE